MNFTISVDDGSGQYITLYRDKGGLTGVETNLFALDGGKKIEDGSGAGLYNAAIEGIVATVLSHFSAGVNVRAASYVKGVRIACENIANQFDFDEP